MRLIERLNLLDRHLIVAKHLHLNARHNFANALNEVVDKRIVIIDQNEHNRPQERSLDVLTAGEATFSVRPLFDGKCRSKRRQYSPIPRQRE
jgi:hypothetical protein